MRIGGILRLVFGASTQEEIATRLSTFGLQTDQTKVSAWMRGRVPNLEQMNAIEACYKLPRGTILVMAGFVDVSAFRKARPMPGPDGIRMMTDRELHGSTVELLGAGAVGSQFAVAAEGARSGRAPKKPGRKVNRPEPPAETG